MMYVYLFIAFLSGMLAKFFIFDLAFQNVSKKSKDKTEVRKSLLQARKVMKFLDQILEMYPMYWGCYSNKVKITILNSIIPPYLTGDKLLDSGVVENIVGSVLSRRYLSCNDGEAFRTLESDLHDHFYDTVEKFPGVKVTPTTIEEALSWKKIITHFNDGAELHSDAVMLCWWIHIYGESDLKAQRRKEYEKAETARNQGPEKGAYIE